MVANFKNQCSSFNMNGKRCRMRSMYERDECYFHSKKKKEFNVEKEFGEDESYDCPMNDVLNKIESVMSIMLQNNEEKNSQYHEFRELIKHIVNIQRVLILVHFVLYASIVHLITDDGENNFIGLLFDYKWIQIMITMATSFYIYLLKNITSSLSTTISVEESTIIDYDGSFLHNDNIYYHNQSNF